MVICKAAYDNKGILNNFTSAEQTNKLSVCMCFCMPHKVPVLTRSILLFILETSTKSEAYHSEG